VVKPKINGKKGLLLLCDKGVRCQRVKLIGKVFQKAYWLNYKKKTGRLIYSNRLCDVTCQTLKLTRVSVYAGLVLFSATFWVLVLWLSL